MGSRRMRRLLLGERKERSRGKEWEGRVRGGRGKGAGFI